MRKLFWTKERVLAALAEAAREIKGTLPSSDMTWNQIKKGRFDWPTSVKILEYFHGMARAWLAAGVGMRRVSLHNVVWTPEEDTYLLDYAGIYTLKGIAAKLGRSYPSVRSRLGQHFHIKSRHNQGYLSAAELSKEYVCPYHRIRIALSEGSINGRFDQIRNQWQIDLANLDSVAEEILTRPKLRSHKNSPTDLGDYYKRYGLHRRIIGGQLTVVSN